MSLKENDVFKENVYENFIDAIENGNYELADKYCREMEDCGFRDEADTMRQKLQDTNLNKFVIASPYV